MRGYITIQCTLQDKVGSKIRGGGEEYYYKNRHQDYEQIQVVL